MKVTTKPPNEEELSTLDHERKALRKIQELTCTV